MTELKWICDQRDKFCVAKGCPHSISHDILEDVLCCEWDHCDTTHQMIRCVPTDL